MYDQQAAALLRAPLPINLRMAQSLRELERVIPQRKTHESLVPVAEHLEAGGTLEPEAFSAYFSIVRSLLDSGMSDLAPYFSLIFKGVRPITGQIAIRILSSREFGSAGIRSVRKNFASSSLKAEQMAAVPRDAEPEIKRKISDALALIQVKAPSAWSELSPITAEIVATLGVPRKGMTFDGCSSIERYGSILINMRRKRTRLMLAETIIHESAHSLLFAMSCNNHRVLNPETETYKSPLRIDPRPLDGIYHAVFVIARMYGFIAEIALNPATSSRMRAEACKLLPLRHRNFLDGFSVLAEHARLTPIGRQLLVDAVGRVERATQQVSAAFPEFKSRPAI
jgi:hypothetical protein